MTEYEHPSFVAAFFALQRELPEIAKSSRAEIPNRAPTHYASLKAVSDAVMPLFGKYGFLWSCQPTMDDGKPVLRYELTHVSHTADNPQQRTGLYPIFGDNAPQKLGAAITYARRYALGAVLGLTPENEEDSEGKPVSPATVATIKRRESAAAKKAEKQDDPDAVAGGPPLPGEPVAMMTRPQQGRIFALLRDLGVSDVDRGAWVNRILSEANQPNVSSFKELTIVAAGHVMTGLERELAMRTTGEVEDGKS